MVERTEETRRRLLRLASGAAVAGLAGCAGGPEAGGSGGDGTRVETATGAGGGREADAVPAAYATATDRAGMVRDPGALATKEAVSYRSEPSGGQGCSDCRYYVPDRNGDGLGACSIVEGRIDPDGWCASFAPI